jgi:hypothetical protein
MSIVQSVEDGLIVEKADYSVVRVSLVDMDDSTFSRFLRAVARCELDRVAVHANTTLFYARLRRSAETKGEEHRYVNVDGGTEASLSVTTTWLGEAGLGKFAKVVPGPLLRATRGKLLTHMPLAPDSSYTHVVGALREAFEISSDMEEPDTELDLEGLSKPKVGHHTLRRTGDKLATNSMDETGALEEDIDDIFGWDQRARAKKMNVHYAGRKQRARLARVTMMI